MNDSLHLLWIPALTALVIFVVSVSLLTFAEMSARAKTEPQDKGAPGRRRS